METSVLWLFSRAPNAGGTANKSKEGPAEQGVVGLELNSLTRELLIEMQTFSGEDRIF